MKKILGSLVFLSLSLFAKSAYEWKIDLKDKDLYLHQATVLTMECSFSKEGKNDDVEFIPPQDSPFTFKLLSEKRSYEGSRQTLIYTYLLFAKKVGAYALKLQPKMLFTTQSAIDNVIVGRDNINELAVEKEIAKIDPIAVNIQETSSAITGRLRLKSDLDLSDVSAYEPVHLEIVLEGEGNLQELSPIVFDIEGVKVFSDEVEQQYSAGNKGYEGKWIQRFAFVGQKDFIIPSVSIHYFDLDDKEEKTLNTKMLSIGVKEDGIIRDSLIDKVDLPSMKIDFSMYLGYLYYMLTFIAGFIAAKLFRLPQRTPKKEKGEKIKKAKNEKELLGVLIVCEKNLFSPEIEELELAVYKGGKVELAAVKKRALSRL